MAAYQDAGVKLYALSYDEPDAIADYATANGVTYTMLSDPDSAVINDFGILNTSIPPDDHPWYGIPFPGAYVIAADGTITAKFFEHNFAVRSGPEQMLAAALGQAFEVEAATPVEQVSVEISFEGDRLPMGVTREIVATFRVPSGQHLYGEPVPVGLVAAAIQVTHQANAAWGAVGIRRSQGKRMPRKGHSKRAREGSGRFGVRLGKVEIKKANEVLA